MNKQKIGELLEKYRRGQASAAEKKQLLNWYRTVAGQDATYPDEEDVVEQRMLARLQHQIEPSRRLMPGYTRWIAVAAVLLIVGVTALLFWPKPVSTQQNVSSIAAPARILPGSSKAILTIAGGKKIVLTDAKNGLLAKQHEVYVTKAADGQLIYHTAEKQAGATNQIVENTLTTPRGGVYQVVLPDGSHVWLNAASSLTYPSELTGKERIVKLTGEAYFEVAKDPTRPFKVIVDGGQTVEVLGTHFNINAYHDEGGINTTLLEGSVRLTAQSGQQVMLRPGQIAVNSNGALAVHSADIQQVMAWRNGLFVFRDEKISDVLKTISRWYDVDIEIKGNIQNKEFGGVTSRYKDITDFLEILRLSGDIHYKIEGRRVIVMD